MKTYYVIRAGWNAANQSWQEGKANPTNQFESRELKVIGIVEAKNPREAEKDFLDCAYPDQTIFAVSNPRSIRGLSRAIIEFENPEWAACQ